MNKKSGPIEHLFGSSTRVKMLRLFLHHPDDSFYVRELSRRLGVQIHAIRRELSSLENIGLLSSRREKPPKEEIALKAKGGRRVPMAERKYYQVNKDFLLFQELRALLTKADLLVQDKIVERMKALGSLQYVALTGRFVGDESIGTDMMIVGLLPKKPLASVVQAFEKEIGHEVNYTILTPREYKYRKDVTDRFLYTLLEAQKVVLIDKTAALQGSVSGKK